MIKNTLIIALLIALIYLYYQQKKTNFLTGNSDSENTIQELSTQLQQANQLQEYNTQQLTNYESQVNRLQKQNKTLQGNGD